jgi:hypothetical protein
MWTVSKKSRNLIKTCIYWVIFKKKILIILNLMGQNKFFEILKGLIDWLIIYGFTSRSRIFHLYEDITIAGEGLQNLGLCSALRAFEQGRILSCHTCCDRGHRFFQSHPKDRPILSPLTTYEGTWRIYSKPEPQGVWRVWKIKGFEKLRILKYMYLKTRYQYVCETWNASKNGHSYAVCFEKLVICKGQNVNWLAPLERYMYYLKKKI